MPVYSSESLKRHPWLWKYDSRRDGRCQKIGHRHRWFKHTFDTFYGFFGLCKKCPHVAFYRIVINQSGDLVKVNKQFANVIELDFEQAQQVMGQIVEEEGWGMLPEYPVKPSNSSSSAGEVGPSGV